MGQKSFADDVYFSKLNESLQQRSRSLPCLVIDLDVLDRNIKTLKSFMPRGADFRIVVKSLPSSGMLEYIMRKAETEKLMVFHEPFLLDLARTATPSVDILLGKPMPIKTAAHFYDEVAAKNGFDPSKQLQWLVDTVERVEEYVALAKAKNIRLLLNLEIDVGLRRGGFDNMAALRAALQIIEDNSEHVSFSGFMGYDAYIVKVPSLLLTQDKAYQQTCDFYNACKQLVKEQFSQLWREDLTFNGAGSPTLALHNPGGSPLNDLSLGSCLVKPVDFDIDSLSAFEPACYIATPILKHQKNTRLPSIERFAGLLNLSSKSMKNSYYLYGGSWMADLYAPQGVKANAIFGKSTNQVMVNAPDSAGLTVGDFVFYRPHQSEHVFLQLGKILPYREGEGFSDEWDLLEQL